MHKSLLTAVLAGVAGLALLATTGIASSFELNGVAWRHMPVSYCINTTSIPADANGEPILTTDEFAEMVRNAFEKWEDLPSSSVRFVDNGICNGNRAGRIDGVNVVGWANLGPRNLLGYAPSDSSDTKYLRAGTVYEIFESDVILNTNARLIRDDLEYYLDTVLPHTILHEIGHMIGLGHSGEECAVMTAESLYPLEFCEDDIDGAAWLYP